MSITYRALDGGLVHVVASAALGPASSQVVARSNERRVSALPFASGGTGFAEGLAFLPDLARDVAVVHELELQGGRLRILSGYQAIGADQVEYFDTGPDGTPLPQPVHFGEFGYDDYSLLATRYSGTADDLLALLDDFTISTTPEGIVCVPTGSSISWWHVQPASVIVDVPGTGVLEVFELAGNKARAAPRHRGTQVAGGELYVGQPEGDHPHFLLIGDSTVTYLSPFSPDETQPAIDFLTGLRVTWAR